MKKLVLFLSLFVTACASGPYPVSSPYFLIPEGSILILKQTLTIPPNAGRVYIQYGKTVTHKEKDQYYPHCWFITWKISASQSLIIPDEFIISSSRKDETFVHKSATFLLASTDIIVNVGMSTGATAIEYSTTLTIHSDKQADIRQFVCSHWEDPTDAGHLTLSQINAVLGNIAEIKLK